MRVLISAYACEPYRGSEPGVGWNWTLQAALHGHDVHVVTRANNREIIETQVGKRLIAGLTFHYLDLPTPLPQLKRRLGFVGLMAYYYLWQLAFAWKAKKLHRKYDFDLAHHVTFANDWAPSGLAVVAIPFIWGPVGGSTHLWPTQIEPRLPPYARRHEAIRRWVIAAATSVDPLRHLTGKRASVILTYTHEALAGLKLSERTRAQSVVHIGISNDATQLTAHAPLDSSEFRIVTGGRLVHWKGFDLLIEALAEYNERGHRRARLLVTGDGRYRTYLESLVRDRRLSNVVEFLGYLSSREDVINVLLECHLYALPTLRDGPPVAILEAMSVGLPVLCLDHGATREMVPENGGFKIPVRNREQVIMDIANALETGASDLWSLRQKGARARDYVYSIHQWDRIGDSIDRLYQALLSGR